MHNDTRTFAVVDLRNGKGEVTGTISVPENFSTNGLTISHISGRVKNMPIEKAVLEGSTLHLTTHSPTNIADKDEWTMTLPKDGKSSLGLVGMPMAMAAWPMQSDPTAKVSLDWDAERTYALLDSGTTSSPEMAEIFKEDQDALRGVVVTKENKKKIVLNGRPRRKRVREMIDQGELHSGLDFERAAYIFQHGEDARDFLMGHVLAMAAMARGDGGASWIASVTLDAYLLAIGQAQVLRTQMNFGVDKGLRQPDDNMLVPKTLKRQLGLVSAKDEQEQIKEIAQPGFVRTP